jgi:hypothetical protein
VLNKDVSAVTRAYIFMCNVREIGLSAGTCRTDGIETKHNHELEFTIWRKVIHQVVSSCKSKTHPRNRQWRPIGL